MKGIRLSQILCIGGQRAKLESCMLPPSTKGQKILLPLYHMLLFDIHTYASGASPTSLSH